MFSGTGVALITPFDDQGQLDFSALQKQVNYVIDGGVDFLVALGSTGETPTLTHQEQLEALKCIQDANQKRLPIVVGLSGNHTRELLERMDRFPLDSVDGILTAVPSYNKPSQEGIYQHFKQVAEHIKKPIILYNVPGRTSRNMLPETTLRLAHDFSNIVGVKEASGDIQQGMALVKGAPEGFSVLSGDDDLSFPQMTLGFKGIVSVAANAFPKTFSNMVRQTAENHNLEAARSSFYHLLEAIHLLFEEGNPTGIKAMMAIKGIAGPHLRLPLMAASKSLEDRLRSFADVA